jgi:hypothetical protein
MRSQREVYQSLLDGKTLISNSGEKRRIDFSTGILVNEKGNKAISFFNNPNSWSEYKEQQWYENIPSEGVLCWVDDDKENIKDGARIIKRKDYGFIDSEGFDWKYATPVKPEECYQSVN